MAKSKKPVRAAKRVPLPTPFRALVDRARRRGLPPDAPPREWTAMADACETSRPYFYALLQGRMMPSPHFETEIAAGLGVTVATVHRALAESVAMRSAS